MALRRFYIDQELEVGYSIELPKEEAEHARKSLRLQAGDKVLVFNGLAEFLAEITMLTKREATLRITERKRTPDLQGARLTLVQSLIKPANFELVIQKVTELGIDEIIPLITEYGQQKADLSEKKQKRWDKIVIEACKQSERITVPEIGAPLDFDELLSTKADYDNTLLFTLPRDEVTSSHIREIESVLAESNTIRIAIGPEGGFSPTELEKAERAGFRLVNMGDEVLKSETAAVSAVTLVKYLAN